MTTTDQILRLGDRWVAAEIAGDVAGLDAVVTDDFKLVGPFGFVLDKEQWLDRYRSGDFTTTALSWHDVDVREHGATSLTIGTQSQEASYRGTPSNGDFRITHVFVREGDSWRIAGMQLSLTSPPAPPASPVVTDGHE
jgi:ketosteroid isomerase-like protein